MTTHHSTHAMAQRAPVGPHRRHAIALSAGLALAVAQAPAQAQITFVKSVLGFGLDAGPVNVSSQATAISDSGIVVGSYQFGGTESSFIWLGPDKLAVIAGTAALPRSQAVGVNNSGQVLVNLYAPNSSSPSAAVWTADGGLTPLATGGSLSTMGTAISANGTVSGWADWDGGNFRAWTWSSTGATLPMAGNERGMAWAVNNRGLAVGESMGQAMSWLGGAATPLALRPGQEWGSAFGVNDRGQIVGTVGLDGGAYAAIWDPRQQPRVIAGSGSDALAINALGQVLVQRADTTRALWSEAGGLREFDSLAGIGSGFRANALNALGQMVGQQDGRAAIYTPTGSLNWQGASGASLLDGASWDSGVGLAPSRLLDLVIDGGGLAVAPAGFVEPRSLRIGGGASPAALQLQPGAQIVPASPVTVQAQGTLSGTGLIVGGLDNVAGTVRPGDLSVAGGFINRGSLLGGGTVQAGLDNRGLVQVGAGQTLRLQPAPLVLVLPGVGAAVVGVDDATALHHINSGSIQVEGGTLLVSGAMRNNSGNDGGIALRDGQASFANGLINAGRFTLAGTVQVDGRLQNLAGASLGAVSRGTQALFTGDVSNDGVFSLLGGGRARFTGAVDGGGSFLTYSYHSLRGGEIVSTLRFEGTLNPGHGIGSLTLGHTELAGRLVMELGATSDHLITTGTLKLQAGSALQLRFVDGASAAAGSQFHLFDFGIAPVGQFGSLLLPTLNEGLAWDLSALYASGTASVVLASSVPEPGTWALLLAGIAALAGLCRRGLVGGQTGWRTGWQTGW